MAVRITNALRDVLHLEDLDSHRLMSQFEQWKRDWPSKEYDAYQFGKDGAYVRPEVGGAPYSLRHVHLPPLLDLAKLRRWNKGWQFRSRKTSNRVLVYSEDGRGNYLLIYVLNEPDAHEIARMRTPEHRELMEGFAAVAEAFLQGDVLG
jgi:mRNA interferase YafO